MLLFVLSSPFFCSSILKFSSIFRLHPTIRYLHRLLTFHQTQLEMNGLSLSLFLYPDQVSKNLLYSLKHSLVAGTGRCGPGRVLLNAAIFFNTRTQDLFLSACIHVSRNRFALFYRSYNLFIYSVRHGNSTQFKNHAKVV